MTLKLLGIFDEPKEKEKTFKEKVEDAKDKAIKQIEKDFDLESTGYLTPEEVIAVSADKVE